MWERAATRPSEPGRTAAKRLASYTECIENRLFKSRASRATVDYISRAIRGIPSTGDTPHINLLTHESTTNCQCLPSLFLKSNGKFHSSSISSAILITGGWTTPNDAYIQMNNELLADTQDRQSGNPANDLHLFLQRQATVHSGQRSGTPLGQQVPPLP
jgi:hypothetical protein